MTEFSEEFFAGCMRGTHKGGLPGMPATGRRIEIRGASIFEFGELSSVVRSSS